MLLRKPTDLGFESRRWTSLSPRSCCLRHAGARLPACTWPVVSAGVGPGCITDPATGSCRSTLKPGVNRRRACREYSRQKFVIGSWLGATRGVRRCRGNPPPKWGVSYIGGWRKWGGFLMEDLGRWWWTGRGDDGRKHGDEGRWWVGQLPLASKKTVLKRFSPLSYRGNEGSQGERPESACVPHDVLGAQVIRRLWR